MIKAPHPEVGAFFISGSGMLVICFSFQNEFSVDKGKTLSHMLYLKIH